MKQVVTKKELLEMLETGYNGKPVEASQLVKETLKEVKDIKDDQLIGLLEEADDNYMFQEASIMFRPDIETGAMGLEFGDALRYVKARTHVMFRAGWNGITDEKQMKLEKPPRMYVLFTLPNDEAANDVYPYFVLKTPNGKYQPGWLAAQPDLFSNDWCIISNGYLQILEARAAKEEKDKDTCDA